MLPRVVEATRYVTPLREGGSMPAIVEGDDLGLYVLKFRGAGQGPLALVAEWISGEIGRALGLRVPELVRMNLDPVLGRSEPDYEIRHLIQSSGGVNLGMDYLPGSMMFDPVARTPVDEAEASSIVWFDAFISNVDRTARNANLLWWHKKLYLIDHGASLYFQHNWGDTVAMAASRFTPIREHVLLKRATRLELVDGELRGKLSEAVFQSIVDDVPEEWLAKEERARYVRYLTLRLGEHGFVEEAVNARNL